MADPISFPNSTPVYALPLLFSGQAQKEFFINQSTSLIDSLLAKCVESSSASPPVAPVEGSAYRIIAAAQGDWANHEDKIATYIGGAWVFVPPFDGMTVFDRNLGAIVHYQSGWESAVKPAPATGGTTVDAELRQIVNELVEALRKVGVLHEST